MKCFAWFCVVMVTMPLATSRAAQEPVIGGPCEGCELVFIEQPSQTGSSARIAGTTERGRPLVIEGHVTTADGKPAAGVIIYAYHTDDGGEYPHGITAHGRLRGWVRTDSTGAYRFDTIRPGAYPARNIPQHVHMHVIEPGRGTYYIDDLLFDDDPLLTVDRLKAPRAGRGGDGLAHPHVDRQSIWHVRRDIALGKNIPGYR